MTRSWLFALTLTVASFLGCVPPKPPDVTVGFPAKSGEIEVRHRTGDTIGEIGSTRWSVHKTLVYIKDDGSDVRLRLLGPSFHKFRPEVKFSLRTDYQESYTGSDGSLGRSDSTYLREQDVYVDSRNLTRDEFDQIAQVIKENLDKIEAAYGKVWAGTPDGLNIRLMTVLYYDFGMFNKQYDWPGGQKVYLRLDSYHEGRLNLHGRNMWFAVGQVARDGRQLLLCDPSQLDQHPTYKAQIGEATKEIDKSEFFEAFVDQNGNSVLDHFQVTTVPATNALERFQQERLNFVPPTRR